MSIKTVFDGKSEKRFSRAQSPAAPPVAPRLPAEMPEHSSWIACADGLLRWRRAATLRAAE